MMKRFAFFLFAMHLTSSAFINKYSLAITNMDLCPDNDRLRNPIRNLKSTSYNRTHKTFSYDFTYDRPIDEKVGGSVAVARWGAGGWIDIPFVGFQKDICNFYIKHFKAHWVSYHRNAGVPDPDKCPVPAGNYSLRNYSIDTAIVNFPFFSGRFRVTVRMQDSATKEVIQCYIYMVDVTEST